MQAFQRNQSVWCVPSQNGGVLVRLHWHKATSFSSFTENPTGVIPGRIALLHRLIRIHDSSTSLPVTIVKLESLARRVVLMRSIIR